MHYALLMLLAVLGGLMNPVQSGLSTAMVKAIERPFLVAVITIGLGLLCALIGAAVAGQLMLPAGTLGKMPWWVWLVGLTGFTIAISRPYAAPVLGAGTYTALTLTASIVLSIVLDHYGMLGFEPHAAHWGRILGAALMVLGVFLVSVF